MARLICIAQVSTKLRDLLHSHFHPIIHKSSPQYFQLRCCVQGYNVHRGGASETYKLTKALILLSCALELFNGNWESRLCARDLHSQRALVLLSQHTLRLATSRHVHVCSYSQKSGDVSRSAMLNPHDTNSTHLCFLTTRFVQNTSA